MTQVSTFTKKENIISNDKVKSVKSSEEIINHLKITRTLYKDIMNDLLLDKMESNPELLHTIKSIKKNLKFGKKYLPCICNQYLKFENKLFYLYICNNGINYAFIIKEIDDKDN